MTEIKTTALNWGKYLIEANFYFSLVILIAGSGVSLSSTYTLFEFNEAVYGELANNLRMIMVYLAFTEILIFVYCYVTRHYHYYLLVGFFLIVMVGSLSFYGEVNNVEIDPNLDLFLYYTGFSHALFGAMTQVNAGQAD